MLVNKGLILKSIQYFHENVEIIQLMVWNKISKFEQYTPVVNILSDRGKLYGTGHITVNKFHYVRMRFESDDDS